MYEIYLVIDIDIIKLTYLETFERSLQSHSVKDRLGVIQSRRDTEVKMY
jgi:hypothetical protein